MFWLWDDLYTNLRRWVTSMMGSKGKLSFILVFNKLLDWEVEDVQRVLGKSVLLFELWVVEEMWFKTLSAVDGCEIDVVFYSEKWKIHRNEKIRNMYQNILIPCNCNKLLFFFKWYDIQNSIYNYFKQHFAFNYFTFIIHPSWPQWETTCNICNSKNVKM